MRRRERPILSSPTSKIAGKNRIPVSFEAVANPTATPANPANHQLRVSAHRHPRYRASVEKKIKKTSRFATRPKVMVSGEMVHRASASTPTQYPAARRPKANSTRPVKSDAVAEGIRTTPASEEPNTTWVAPKMYFAKNGCSWLMVKSPSWTYLSPAIL